MGKPEAGVGGRGGGAMKEFEEIEKNTRKIKRTSTVWLI